MLVVLEPESPIIEVFGPLGEVFGCLHELIEREGLGSPKHYSQDLAM